MAPEKQTQIRPYQQKGFGDGCDESKCVSYGLAILSKYSYTCYADGYYNPMACDDGYQPRIVESESLLSDLWGINHYFTCCPPEWSAETNVSRHCSDPAAIIYEAIGEETNINNTSIICDDNTRPYPRPMKTRLFENLTVESYTCCDFVENENTSIVELVNSDQDLNDECDESKCVSGDLGYRHNYSFTCYGNAFFKPLMCADGYQPRVVESEPLLYEELPYKYFTCCPPDMSTEIHVARNCSDPLVTEVFDLATDDGIDDDSIGMMLCNNDTRPYPRRMKTHIFSSYMCCDSGSDENKTTDFLDDTECVPYHNEFYEQIYSNTATCIFPDGEFQFPHIISEGRGIWKCCKTRPAPPILQTVSEFKMTMYPQIAISSIAVVSCVIMILGLSIPLLMQFKNQKTQRTQQTHRRARGLEPWYSTYNLYLVYLAIPNLVLNLYLLGIYRSDAYQRFDPEFHGAVVDDLDYNSNEISGFEGAVVLGCSTANLYLNAVISYELLNLVRNAHQVGTSDQPKIFKVTLQALAVYFFSVIVFIIHFCISSAGSKAFDDMDDTSVQMNNRLQTAKKNWSLVVTYILPIGFLSYVCIAIGINSGDMPAASGRNKELAWYFFRLLVVSYLLWLPGMYFLIVGTSNEEDGERGIIIGLLVCSVQPIVSTCMAMTKSDVKEYTLDLITLSYICKSEAQRTENFRN